MFTTRPVFSLVLLVAGAIGATIATPAPAAADDCGADYLQCLNDTDSLEGSDPLHETECYGEYTDCIARQIRFY